MKRLLVFLHGLRGNQETWGTVPTIVRTALGADYSYICPEFSATPGSAANHERSADQVLGALAAGHADKDLIYLIGYSDGGLIARAICRKLLLDPTKDEMTKRIASVVTVGTPLEGPRYLGAAAIVSDQLPWKLSEIVQRPVRSDGYKSAIAAAKTRNVRRPFHYHIELENDRWAAPHKIANYTEDDKKLEVLSGGHTDFISTRPKVERLANVIVKQIRATEGLLGKAYFPPVAEDPDAGLPDRLILLSCSNRKRDGGSPDYQGSPLAFLSDGTLRQRILSKRTHVFRRLTESKIEDAFKAGSNRIHEAPNQALKYGPDFGGLQIDNERGLYLPAYHRYNGRSYRPIPEASWHGLDRSRVRVLIMSGLYGLFDSHEMIQDYDVHLTDTDIEAGVSLSALWSEHYTQTLATYIDRSKKERPVRIFNLLCDEDYVRAVQWHMLPAEKCEVYHLASPTMNGKQLLPCAGTVANAFFQNPGRMEDLANDLSEHELSDFGLPPPGIEGKILFEPRVHQGKTAAVS